MSAFPSLPLFTDAYFGDTKHLSCEEHGAYLQLLMIAWRSPGCCVPDDDRKIARMINISVKRWLSIKPTVMAFWTLTDGVWTQARLNREHAWVSSRIQSRRDAGKLGGRPKSLKNNESDKAKGFENEKQNQSKPKAPTPTPTPIKKEDTRTAHAREASPIPEDWQPTEADRAFALSFCAGSPETLEREIQRFRDTNLADGRVVSDWDAWFRNWITNPHAGKHRAAHAAQRAGGPPVAHMRPITRNGELANFLRLEERRRARHG
jgi:uncharacterized protein YdaU (DUF1376 family)